LAEIKEDRQCSVLLPYLVGAVEFLFRTRLRFRGRCAHALPHYSDKDVVRTKVVEHDFLRFIRDERRDVCFHRTSSSRMAFSGGSAEIVRFNSINDFDKLISL
jgi:hypothetical protein